MYIHIYRYVCIYIFVFLINIYTYIHIRPTRRRRVPVPGPSWNPPRRRVIQSPLMDLLELRSHGVVTASFYDTQCVAVHPIVSLWYHVLAACAFVEAPEPQSFKDHGVRRAFILSQTCQFFLRQLVSGAASSINPVYSHDFAEFGQVRSFHQF